MADTLGLKELIDIIVEERGVDLRSYKITTLERRIRRRMSELNIAILGRLHRSAFVRMTAKSANFSIPS